MGVRTSRTVGSRYCNRWSRRFAFTAESEKTLGVAIAAKVKEILESVGRSGYLSGFLSPVDRLREATVNAKSIKLLLGHWQQLNPNSEIWNRPRSRRRARPRCIGIP